jgi:putative endonuclease
MYYVYILECCDKTLYAGITVDLERRIKEHNSSKLGAKYTGARRPVALVYAKKFRNRSKASKEEARIKKLTKIEKLEIIRKYETRIVIPDSIQNLGGFNKTHNLPLDPEINSG